MPLPFIIGAIAIAAGTAGVGAGVHGAVKMKKASDIAKEAQRQNEENVARLEENNKKTMKQMDILGKHEMKILASFNDFSDLFEKIKNKPQFKEIKKDNIVLSIFTPKEVKDAAVGASVLLGGLGGAALGTAGGFAAAGGTTAAVMALGTASTGTAIASLSGVAATNATLAALGGGSIAAGGGGMALGTAVLGGATLGVGLLIGGIIFSVAGSSISDKADKAYEQMKKNERKIKSVCKYLEKLSKISASFDSALNEVNKVYKNYFAKLKETVESECDYRKFSCEQRLILENTVLLVGLLYEMCKVQLVEKADTKKSLNKINEDEIFAQIEKSKQALQEIQRI